MLVVGFELALLVVSIALLDRVSVLVATVVAASLVIETVRLRRASGDRRRGEDRREDQWPEEVSPPPAAGGTEVVGRDVAVAQGLDPDGDDPAAIATAAVDVEPGHLDGHRYVVGLHDEVWMLVDEDAVADDDPAGWSEEGPIGAAVLAQPEVAAVLREDREVLHVRPTSASVGPEQIHAAAVRALLELHRRHPRDPGAAG